MADIQSGTENKDSFNEDENLQSTTLAGKPPKSRVANAAAAWSIYKRMRTNDELLAVQRARIKGQKDGNPPFPKAERIRYGLVWMANVSFRRLHAAIRKMNSGVWNMFTSVPVFIDLTLKDKSRKDPQEPTIDYGAIIAQHFTDTLLEWSDFYSHLMLRLDEMHTYGSGPVFWEDEHTWKCTALRTANIHIEKRRNQLSAECMKSVSTMSLIRRNCLR